MSNKIGFVAKEKLDIVPPKAGRRRSRQQFGKNGGGTKLPKSPLKMLVVSLPNPSARTTFWEKKIFILFTSNIKHMTELIHEARLQQGSAENERDLIDKFIETSPSKKEDESRAVLKVVDDFRMANEFAKAEYLLFQYSIALAMFRARTRALGLPEDAYKQPPNQEERKALGVDIGEGLNGVNYWKNYINRGESRDDAMQKARAILASSKAVRAMFEAGVQTIQAEEDAEQAKKQKRLQAELDSTPEVKIEKQLIDEFNQIRAQNSMDYCQQAVALLNKFGWKAKDVSGYTFIFAWQQSDGDTEPVMTIFPNLYIGTDSLSFPNFSPFEIQNDIAPPTTRKPKRLIVPAQVILQNRDNLKYLDSIIEALGASIPLKDAIRIKSQGLIKIIPIE